MKTMVRTIGGWTAFLFFLAQGTAWCNQAPDDFNLVSPPDGAADVSIPLVLEWEDAKDPDGDTVSYTVTLSEKEDFSNPIVIEGVQSNKILITEDDNLKEDTGYYWKVTAIDNEGASEEAGPWYFVPSINPTDVVVRGFVFDVGAGSTISDATLIYGNKTLTTGADGSYLGSVSFQTEYTVNVGAECYVSEKADVVEVEEGDEVYREIGLSRDPLGDIDGEDCVDLTDAVIALRILAGGSTGGAAVNLAADVNGDDAIGLAEAIFAMERAAGIR